MTTYHPHFDQHQPGLVQGYRPVETPWLNTILVGDCFDVMQTLPDGCASIVVTSPPYEDCRLYKPLEFKAKGQAWVDWMIPRVVEMCRVSSGLVFVNMAGKVRDFKYSPVVEWLVTDLTRNCGIVCGPAPYVFHRIGIPGSGGPHYHRRDWEPVYAFARPENLPPKWSDNTAMGHPPKWAPGGEMSKRLSDGSRVNQWGHPYDSGATVVDPDGSVRSEGTRPSHKLAGRDQWGGTGHATSGEGRKANGEHKTRNGKRRPADKLHTKAKANGEMETQSYVVPVLANPGNTIQEKYTADQIAELLAEAGDVTHHLVGGGVMGDHNCHDNEAPFPETLAEFFIRSFAPEGGVVLDPFSGSGTVAKVAQRWGRNFIGIDARESQVKLASKRLKEHGHTLFG